MTVERWAIVKSNLAGTNQDLRNWHCWKALRSFAPGGQRLALPFYLIDSEMTNDVDNSKVNLDAIRRTALKREIRKVENRIDNQKRMNDKGAELATYKKELLDKVEDHLEELKRGDSKRADLSKFKDELLGKVEEHMSELEKSSSKREDLAKFKQEMLDKVKNFSSAAQ